MSSTRTWLALLLVLLSSATTPSGLASVALHEGGHALAALLTGGEILELGIGPDLHGRTRVRGGEPVTVLLSGHLVAVLLPGLLLGLALRLRGTARLVLSGLIGAVYLRALGDAAFHGILQPGPAGDAGQLSERTGVPARAWGLGWILAGLVPLLRYSVSCQVSSKGPKPRA